MFIRTQGKQNKMNVSKNTLHVKFEKSMDRSKDRYGEPKFLYWHTPKETNYPSSFLYDWQVLNNNIIPLSLDFASESLWTQCFQIVSIYKTTLTWKSMLVIFSQGYQTKKPQTSMLMKISIINTPGLVQSPRLPIVSSPLFYGVEETLSTPCSN